MQFEFRLLINYDKHDKTHKKSFQLISEGFLY